MTKVSEREHKALEALFETYCNSEEGACIYSRTIASRSGLKENEARNAVRALVRKGLAEYHRGLFDDEGMVAGSGFCLSKEGAELMEKEEKQQQEEETYRPTPLV